MKQRVKSKRLKVKGGKDIKRQPRADSRKPLTKSLTANRFPLIAKRGFTMIELLVVIVVMGIILAFSLPAIHTTKLRFDQAVDGVYAKLKFAKQEAMTEGINYGIDWNANALWVFKDENGDTVLNTGEYSDTITLGPGDTLWSNSHHPVDFNLDGTINSPIDINLMLIKNYQVADSVKITVTLSGMIYKTP